MYSITQFGKPLDKSKYTIDEKTKTFSSNEDNLVLDFSDEYGWTFKTYSNCTFKTGFGCTFKTGFGCTFNTGSDCTFDTGSDCTFDTFSNCTFDTDSGCTFKTGEQCVVVRRDVYEVIELPEEKTVKLNEWGIKGFSVEEEVDNRTQEAINLLKKNGYKIIKE